MAQGPLRPQDGEEPEEGDPGDGERRPGPDPADEEALERRIRAVAEYEPRAWELWEEVR